MAQKRTPMKHHTQRTSYAEAISLLNSLQNLPRSEYMANLKQSGTKARRYLRRTQKLLDLIGNPERELDFFHIAGTSGKGTTAALLHSILTAAKIKVGSFLSPYPTVAAEKIIIKDRLASPSDIARAVPEIFRAIETMISSRYSPPSYYETWLALALLIFARKKLTHAIIETGVGGEYDASNIIPKKIASIITLIHYDHQDLLGNTLAEIAQAKAGIIRHGTPVITAEQLPPAQRIIKKKAQSCRAPLTTVKASELTREAEHINPSPPSLGFQTFSFHGSSFTIPLIGKGMRENAALAVSAAELVSLPPSVIQQGLKLFSLPIRQEIVNTRPLVILDAAHNPHKMEELRRIIDRLTYNRLFLIIALKEKKNSSATLKPIVPRAHAVYCTRFLTPSFFSCPLPTLTRTAARYAQKKTEIRTFINPHEAITNALSRARPTDAILVTGSIYMVGEIRRRWYPSERILSQKTSFPS